MTQSGDWVAGQQPGQPGRSEDRSTAVLSGSPPPAPPPPVADPPQWNGSPASAPSSAQSYPSPPPPPSSHQSAPSAPPVSHPQAPPAPPGSTPGGAPAGPPAGAPGGAPGGPAGMPPGATPQGPGAPGSGPPGSGSQANSTAARARMMGERGHPRVTVGGRGPRRARLRLRRIDPWSVLKFTMVLGFALWVVGVVASTVLYLLLAAAGVWGKVNDLVTQFTGQNNFKITASNMIGGVTVIGLINVVLFTALATVAAFIYNLCADLVGGIDLTLTESDDPSEQQQRGWRRPLSR